MRNLIIAAVIFAAGWVATKHFIVEPMRAARYQRARRRRLNR